MAWEIPKNFAIAWPGGLYGGGNHISKFLKFLLITEYGLILKIWFLTVFFRLQIRLHIRKMLFQPYFSPLKYGYYGQKCFFDRSFAL